MKETIRTYSELSKLTTFKERFEYLKLGDRVGAETFGSERYLNQLFYHDPAWQKARREVILRDNGCDLGVEGYDIPDGRMCFIHHLNPITEKDIINRDSKLFDLDNLITTTRRTHNAIHYGSDDFLFIDNFGREPNDTCPWRK